MCRVDILGTHIVSAWYSLENQVRQLNNDEYFYKSASKAKCEKPIPSEEQDGLDNDFLQTRQETPASGARP
jgi:hypothetical protein